MKNRNNIKLLDLIKSRRSVRDYEIKKIPRNIIEKIIEAARWAPSAHNLQPWKFVIIEDKRTIYRIADILEDKSKDLYTGFNIVMKDTAKNIRKAILLLVVYSTGVISKKFDRLGKFYSEIGKIYEIQSVSNAIENILLYCHSLKLGTAWYGMVLFCEKEINEILSQNNRLMAVLSIGYPKETVSIPQRKDISEITEFIT